MGTMVLSSTASRQQRGKDQDAHGLFSPRLEGSAHGIRRCYPNSLAHFNPKKGTRDLSEQPRAWAKVSLLSVVGSVTVARSGWPQYDPGDWLAP